MKISPRNGYNSVSDANPDETVAHLIQELNKRNIAFLEVVEGIVPGVSADINTLPDHYSAKHKKNFNGTWIANYGYNQDTANEHIKNG